MGGDKRKRDGEQPSDGSGAGGKGKKPCFFGQNQSTRAEVKEGMQGILFTVNQLRDKQAIQEIKNLMGQYVTPRAACTTGSAAGPADVKPEAPSATPGSIASCLGAELAAMKATGGKYSGVRVLQTEVNGNYFVEVPDEDPRELVLRICKDFCGSRQSSTRFMYRMIPCHKVTRPYVPQIKAAAKEVLDQYSAILLAREESLSSASATKKRFMINTKARSNTGLAAASDELKKDIATAAGNELYMVDLLTPEVVLFIYTLQSVTLLGIGEDCSRLQNFNIHELATRGPLTEEELQAKRAKRVEAKKAAPVDDQCAADPEKSGDLPAEELDAIGGTDAAQSDLPQTEVESTEAGENSNVVTLPQDEVVSGQVGESVHVDEPMSFAQAPSMPE